MIRRLFNLQAAATGRVLATRLACFTCLAWCLQACAARGDEPVESEGEQILPARALLFDSDAPTKSNTPLVHLASRNDYVIASDDPAASGDAEGNLLKSPRTASTVASWPTFVSATGEKTSWIPQGVIPYFGPRTPDSEKDRGIADPLEGRGWRTRPFAISGFSGITAGNALIPGHVLQQPSFYGGLNLGWDYDHFWGIEKRLGFGALNLANGHHDPIGGTNLSFTGEYRLMYYPLGDARWRPFVTTGIGWSDFYFQDDVGDKHLDTVGMVPFGLGLKYLHHDNLALRVDLIDELTIGAGALSTFHYVALTAGLELRYGHRLLKMPWHKADSEEN